MMMRCGKCKALRDYHDEMLLHFEKCYKCHSIGSFHVLQFIECGFCDGVFPVPVGTDLAGEICQSCARQGNFTIQPF